MKDKKKANLIQIIGSVFAAMFGVQSDKNRERDFQASNPSGFIIGGIIFTLAFIATVIGIVNLVISNN